MPITKQELIEKVEVRFNDYYRSRPKDLSDPTVLEQLLRNELTFEPTDTKLTLSKRITVLSVNEDGSCDYPFTFSNQTELLTAFQDLSLAELKQRYDASREHFWRDSCFDFATVLAHLPAVYDLDVINLTDVDDYQNKKICGDHKDCIRTVADWPASENAIYDGLNPDSVTLEDAFPFEFDAGPVLRTFYQLRFHQTHQPIGPLFYDFQLPQAVFALAQPTTGDEYWSYSPNDWVVTNVSGTIQRLTRPFSKSAPTTDFYADLMLEPRTQYNELGDPSRYFLLPTYFNAPIPTGQAYRDLLSNNATLFKRLLTQATNHGLTVHVYQRTHRNYWHAALPAYLKRPNFRTLETGSSYDYPEIKAEICRTASSEVLDTDIDIDQLSAYLLKQLWQSK